MGNYVQIDDPCLRKLKDELMPGGHWFFPAGLALQITKRVGLELRQSVRGRRVEEIMSSWDHNTLQFLANKIIGAYRNKAATDYTNFWPSYALYYLPSNFPKVIKLLLDLLSAGVLPRQVRLLDLGVGPGTVPLAILFFYSRLEKYVKDALEIQIDMIDAWWGHLLLANEFVDLYTGMLKVSFPVIINKLAEGCLENGRKQLASTLGKNSKYNLIFLSYVLNEYEINNMNEVKEISDLALNYLAQDGTLAILEPAAKDCAVRLAGLHWRYKSGEAGIKATAFGPCSYPWGLYPGREQSCSCWSFISEPWKKPESIAKLEGFGTPRKNEIKFSYLLLRKDEFNRYRYLQKPELYRRRGFVRLSRIRFYYGQPVNILGVVIHKCSKNGALIIDICDGTSGCHNHCHLEVGPEVTGLPRQVLSSAEHGDLVEVTNVKVLPGTRGSSFTLEVSNNTAARLHRTRQEA
ncbi:hypothetical protein [Desulfolucanica intricata]|uniref:hypothetical protein n=1 Tax=Desulfolucanica intricata TaxID=1285191 RepID=UPI00082D3220|nr:hypothetical protein [Desulfolucanica intricata]